MEDIKSINDIVNFQIHRHMMNLSKESLILLEEKYQYIKILEKLLIEVGIDKYNNSEHDYTKDRSRILSKANDSSRELQSLLNSFDIKLKK